MALFIVVRKPTSSRCSCAWLSFLYFHERLRITVTEVLDCWFYQRNVVAKKGRKSGDVSSGEDESTFVQLCFGSTGLT